MPNNKKGQSYGKTIHLYFIKYLKRNIAYYLQTLWKCHLPTSKYICKRVAIKEENWEENKKGFRLHTQEREGSGESVKYMSGDAKFDL